MLLVEGFRWGAFVFGPLWLLYHRAYIPAVLAAAAWALILAGSFGALRIVLLAGLAILLGLFGTDCRRFALARRGFLLVDVVAARDAEAALARFLARWPDQAGRFG